MDSPLQPELTPLLTALVETIRDALAIVFPVECVACGEPDRLTPADRRAGYQCDECADRAEGVW